MNAKVFANFPAISGTIGPSRRNLALMSSTFRGLSVQSFVQSTQCGFQLSLVLWGGVNLIHALYGLFDENTYSAEGTRRMQSLRALESLNRYSGMSRGQKHFRHNRDVYILL